MANKNNPIGDGTFGTDPSITSPEGQKVQEAISRNNLDYQLQENSQVRGVYKALQQLVSFWTVQDKLNMLNAYHANIELPDKANEKQINDLLCKVLLSRLSKQELTRIVQQQTAKQTSFEHDVQKLKGGESGSVVSGNTERKTQIEDMPEEEEQETIKNDKKIATRYAKNSKDFETELAKADPKIKLGKKFSKTYSRFVKELTALLKTYTSKDLYDVALSIGIEVPDHTPRKEVINQICNSCAYYIALILGKVKGVVSSGFSADEGDAVENLISMTSFAWVVGSDGILDDEIYAKRQQAKLAKIKLKANKKLWAARRDNLKKRDKKTGTYKPTITQRITGDIVFDLEQDSNGNIISWCKGVGINGGKYAEWANRFITNQLNGLNDKELQKLAEQYNAETSDIERTKFNIAKIALKENRKAAENIDKIDKKLGKKNLSLKKRKKLEASKKQLASNTMSAKIREIASDKFSGDTADGSGVPIIKFNDAGNIISRAIKSAVPVYIVGQAQEEEQGAGVIAENANKKDTDLETKPDNMTKGLFDEILSSKNFKKDKKNKDGFLNDNTPLLQKIFSNIKDQKDKKKGKEISNKTNFVNNNYNFNTNVNNPPQVNTQVDFKPIIDILTSNQDGLPAIITSMQTVNNNIISAMQGQTKDIDKSIQNIINAMQQKNSTGGGPTNVNINGQNNKANNNNIIMVSDASLYLNKNNVEIDKKNTRIVNNKTSKNGGKTDISDSLKAYAIKNTAKICSKVGKKLKTKANYALKVYDIATVCDEPTVKISDIANEIHDKVAKAYAKKKLKAGDITPVFVVNKNNSSGGGDYSKILSEMNSNLTTIINNTSNIAENTGNLVTMWPTLQSVMGNNMAASGAIISTISTAISTALNATTKAISDFGKYPHLATGGTIVPKTSSKLSKFISGDSLTSSPNPEAVSVDWSRKQINVQPIVQDTKPNSTNALKNSNLTKITSREKPAPLGVSLTKGTVEYKGDLDSDVTSSDNTALKVYAINDGIYVKHKVGNSELSLFDAVTGLLEVSAKNAQVLSTINSNLVTLGQKPAAVVNNNSGNSLDTTDLDGLSEANNRFKNILAGI